MKKNDYDTPMREDAFKLDDGSKIKKIAFHFEEIIKTLGLDLADDSIKDSPLRIAKMYVEEVFSGLNPKNRPEITLFENTYNYDQMLIEKNISFYSHCEHHFVPMYGKAHVAYFSSGKMIGLSKINRIVQFFAKRPQVQERLTIQIGKEFTKILETEDVAVLMDAFHMCVSSRGVNDTNSKAVTTFYSGKFRKKEYKLEFLSQIKTI